MIRKIIDSIRGMGSATEDDSERDGVLSYADEWHALEEGLYQGLTSRPLVAPEVPSEYTKEDHYYKSGYVLGTLMQVCIMLLVSYGYLQL